MATRSISGLGLSVLLLVVAACGSSAIESVPTTPSNPIGQGNPDDQAAAEPVDDAPSFDDLDTVQLDDEVDGVLEVYCLLDANGQSHAVDAPLALDGFDPDDLPSMQWVHEVIRSSDGSAEYIAAAFGDPLVESDLDATSQVVLTDNTKTFLFQNKVPLIDVETIYPFRTGAATASVLTTYVLDDAQQMLTQRWALDEGSWQRV